MSNENNIHGGHRQRLLKKYTENGIASLEQHEVLEILLFFAFSRCNTNEISHYLLDKFGSIRNLLSAPVDAITEIKGVGQSSALLLRFLGDLFSTYDIHDIDTIDFREVNDVINFCKNNLANLKSETCYYILLDKRKKFITYLTMTDHAFSLVNVDLKNIVNKAFNLNAKMVILLHNHPDGSAIASDSDIRCTRVVAQLFSTLNLYLLDHLIIGNDGYFSVRRSCILSDLWK